MTIAVATTITGFNSTSDSVSSGNMTTFSNSVDAIFNNILNGIQAADRLLFTSPATLTIYNGVLEAPTQALHYVSAESDLIDTLTTIGASNNRFVVLKATSGHTITIASGGNIATLDGSSIVLTGNAVAMAWCMGSQWGVIGGGSGILNNLATTADPSPFDDTGDGYEVGSLWINNTNRRAYINADKTLSNAVWRRIAPWKNWFRYRATNTSVLGMGTNDPTVANSPASANDSNATFVTLPTTASSGNLGGWISSAFTLTRLVQDPVFEFLIKMDSTITSVRVWLGLTSAALTNSDTAAGSFVGFRFSTVAADGGWMPVCRDGSTQSNGIAIGTVLASTVYKLRVRIVSGTPMAYFSVNDGAEQAFATNLPGLSTDLGVVCRCITQAASIRLINFSYAEVGW